MGLIKSITEMEYKIKLYVKLLVNSVFIFNKLIQAYGDEVL